MIRRVESIGYHVQYTIAFNIDVMKGGDINADSILAFGNSRFRGYNSICFKQGSPMGGCDYSMLNRID
jgi:hypothetical protein